MLNLFKRQPDDGMFKYAKKHTSVLKLLGSVCTCGRCPHCGALTKSKEPLGDTCPECRKYVPYWLADDV